MNRSNLACVTPAGKQTVNQLYRFPQTARQISGWVWLQSRLKVFTLALLQLHKHLPCFRSFFMFLSHLQTRTLGLLRFLIRSAEPWIILINFVNARVFRCHDDDVTLKNRIFVTVLKKMCLIYLMFSILRVASTSNFKEIFWCNFAFVIFHSTSTCFSKYLMI